MDYKVLDEEIGIEEDIEEGNIEDDYIALEEKEDSSRTTIDLELFVALFLHLATTQLPCLPSPYPIGRKGCKTRDRGCLKSGGGDKEASVHPLSCRGKENQATI